MGNTKYQFGLSELGWIFLASCIGLGIYSSWGPSDGIAQLWLQPLNQFAPVKAPALPGSFVTIGMVWAGFAGTHRNALMGLRSSPAMKRMKDSGLISQVLQDHIDSQKSGLFIVVVGLVGFFLGASDQPGVRLWLLSMIGLCCRAALLAWRDIRNMYALDCELNT